VARLREKAERDSRCNFLLRQSGLEFRCYTLVYKKPSSRDPVCLQIKQLPDTSHYHLLINDGNTMSWPSVHELIKHYRQPGGDDNIALQQCVGPANPC